jgi:hypothetical protein
MEEVLKIRMKKLLNELEDIIKDVQNYNLQNEQFALDFVDEINKLSVTF